MFKRYAKIGAVLAALTAATFLAIPAGPASADVCSDGLTLANIYSHMGDSATAWQIYFNLQDMGCIQY
jgi:hypothetical protein